MLLIPKYVRIRNPRLNCFYHFLVFCTILSYCGWFFHYRRYNKEVDISHAIDVSAWPHGHSTADLPHLKEQWERVRKSAICNGNFTRVVFETAQEKYDYGVATCRPPCETLAQLQRYECISILDLMRVESATSLFWPTLLTEVGYERRNFSTHLIPYEPVLGVEFSYNYLVETNPLWDVFDVAKQREAANSKTDILTVVMKEDKVFRVIEPQNTIVLSLPEVMEIAGVPGIIHQDNELAKTKTDPDGPPTRATGVEFEIQIKCYNHGHMKNIVAKQGVNSSHKKVKHICMLLIVRSRRSWVYQDEKISLENPNQTQTSLAAASLELKRYHGIRVTFRTEGSWEFIHWMNFFDALIQLLVMVKLPMVAVRFVATSCLGSLSRIYSRVIDEPFGIREQVGGLATRLMANSVTYLDLTDQQDGAGTWGISIGRMRERLGALLSHQKELDTAEIGAMTEFCYRSVMSWQKSKKSEAQALAAFIAKVGRNSSIPAEVDADEDEDEGCEIKLITEDEYGEAMTNCEKLGFHDVVDLFDGDRKMTVMEKIFSPKYLTRLHHNAKRNTLSENTDKRALQITTGSTDGASDPQSMKKGKVYENAPKEMTMRGRRSNTLENQKSEMRQNLNRLQMLEEKGTSLEERLEQADRRYREVLEVLADQEKAIAALTDKENLKSNDSTENKQTTSASSLEKRLREGIEFQLEERGSTINTRLIELESQLQAKLNSNLSELQVQLEALTLRVEELTTKTVDRRSASDSGRYALGSRHAKERRRNNSSADDEIIHHHRYGVCEMHRLGGTASIAGPRMHSRRSIESASDPDQPLSAGTPSVLSRQMEEQVTPKDTSRQSRQSESVPNEFEGQPPGNDASTSQPSEKEPKKGKRWIV